MGFDLFVMQEIIPYVKPVSMNEHFLGVFRHPEHAMQLGYIEQAVARGRAGIGFGYHVC